MTISVVYAKPGVTIKGRLIVRFTGNYTAPCGWEVDLPGKGQRGHAVAIPGPAGEITSTQWGQAETFGPIALVPVSSAVSVDDELETEADGTLTKAGGMSKNRSAVAIAPAAAKTLARVILGWSQLP